MEVAVGRSEVAGRVLRIVRSVSRTCTRAAQCRMQNVAKGAASSEEDEVAVEVVLMGDSV